jgi:hypothetical protein
LEYGTIFIAKAPMFVSKGSIETLTVLSADGDPE